MKKFLKLLCMYIFVTVSVAAGYVFVNGGFSVTPATEQSNAGPKVDPVVSAFMQNMSNLSTVSTQMEISLKSGESADPVTIRLDANLHVAGLFANGTLQGDAVVNISGIAQPIYIYFIQNNLNISYEDISVQVDVNSAMKNIQELLSLLKIDINALAGIDLGAILNPTVLQSMFMGMVSTNNNDGTYTLTLDFDSMVTLEFLIDESYNLKNVSIPTTTMQNTSFSLQASVVTNDENFSIHTPEGTFKNITPVLELATQILPIMQSQMFEMNIHVPKHQMSMHGFLNIPSIEDMRAQFELQYKQQNVFFAMQNNTAFVQAFGNGISLKIDTFYQMLQDVMDSSIFEDVQENIDSLLQNMQEKSITDWFNDISINKVLNAYEIDVCNNKIILTVENNKIIVSANVNGEEIIIEMQSSTKECPVIDASQYVEVDAISHVIPKILPMLQAQTFAFTIEYRNASELFVEGDVFVDIEKGIVSANVVVQQIPIQLVVKGDTLFISVKGLQVKAQIQDLSAVQNMLQSFGLNVNLTEIQTDVQTILQTLNQVVLQKVYETAYGVTLEFKQNMVLELGLGETLSGLRLQYQEHFAEVANVVQDEKRDIIVNETKYITIPEIIEMVTAIQMLQHYNHYSMALKLQGAMSIDLLAGLNLQEQMFGISGMFNNKNIALTMQQYQNASWVFAQYQTIKFGIQKDSISSVLTEVGSVVGMRPELIELVNTVFSANSFDDIFDMLSKITSMPNIMDVSEIDMINMDEVFTVLQKIKSVQIEPGHISFIISGDVFSADATQDVIITCEIENGKLQANIENIVINGVVSTVSAILQGESQPSANIQEVTDETFAQYMDLSSLGNFAKSFNQTANIKTFMLSGHVSISTTGSINLNLADLKIDILVHLYDDLSFDVEINVYDLPIGYMLGAITQNAAFVANYSASNRNLKIIYKDNQIYFKRDVQYKQILFGSNTYRSVEWEETVSPQVVMDNIAEYLAKALALTDTIKNQIANAFTKDKDADQSIESIIPADAYKYYAAENRYALKINGGNLIGDANIGLITADIYAREDGYLHKLNLSMFMVDFLQISLKDLTLTNI